VFGVSYFVFGEPLNRELLYLGPSMLDAGLILGPDPECLFVPIEHPASRIEYLPILDPLFNLSVA
jgi:hypothetical protein